MDRNEKAFWFCLVGLLLAVFWLTSCGSAKQPTVITEKTTETITAVKRDTVIKIEKDSSAIKALLDCQDGKVVIKEIKTLQPGKTVAPPKVSITDNVLTADCETYARELLLSWIETNKTYAIEKQIPVCIEKPRTFFEFIQILFGRLCLALILVWLLFKKLKG